MSPEESARIIGGVLAGARKNGLPDQSKKNICDQSGVSERTLAKIEAGDPSVSLSRYLSVAETLGVTWMFEAFETPRQENAIRYLTGLSALNLIVEGRDSAYWHTSHIKNVKAWSISGVNFSSTQWLLGVADIFRANKSLSKSGVNLNVDIYAASYERAVFDMLYEFVVVREKVIPNIQAKDIDDAVDFDKVMDWIDKSNGFIDSDKLEEMKSWLKKSDYEFNGKPEAA